MNHMMIQYNCLSLEWCFTNSNRTTKLCISTSYRKTQSLLLKMEIPPIQPHPQCTHGNCQTPDPTVMDQPNWQWPTKKEQGTCSRLFSSQAHMIEDYFQARHTSQPLINPQRACTEGYSNAFVCLSVCPSVCHQRTGAARAIQYLELR